jgi:hypothetical protein
MKRIPQYLLCLVMASLAFPFAASAAAPCCNVVSLDAKRQTVTAIDRASAKLFSFTVKDQAVFKSVQVGESFDAPIARMQKDAPFAADLGKQANPGAPCCFLTTTIGGAGQALGVRPHEVSGVDVILMELKRTAGNTVTARWQYLNGSDKALKFKQQGCVGMGCTYTLAETAHILDGATLTKYDVLRDTKNKALAQRFEASKLGVAAHQILGTWAKFEAPPASSSKVTVVVPGVSEPFEDVPITP